MHRFSLTDRILDNAPGPFTRRGKPAWLRAKVGGGEKFVELKALIRRQALHTVCESARCPNQGECWSRGVATLMILGEVCTRSCGFCNVATGRPPALDLGEPQRVGETVAAMNLKHVVITSVNRDELPDGGASIWAASIREIRRLTPHTRLEVLIPDFQGDWAALQLVLDAKPDVLGHNLETVPRLYRAVRPQAKYDRSLELLRRAKQQGFIAKTGIMLGLGETDDEVDALMAGVLDKTRTENGSCDVLTLGQYLQPSPAHLPVARFVEPAVFESFKRRGESLGFRHVESGPLVRSSYHADQQILI